MRLTRISSFLGVLFCALLSVTTFQGTAAQSFIEQFEKPLSKLDLQDEASFNEATRLYEESASAGSPLAYEIRIPKTWSAPMEGVGVDGGIDEGFLGIVGRFYGPPNTMAPRSKIEIRSYKLKYQLTVKEWMVQYLTSSGYSFQGMDVYNDEALEAAYVVFDNANSFLVRSVAVINGKNLIIVEYFVPIERYDEEKIQQNQIIKSFKLRNIVDEFAEAMETYQFLDLASMQYPESWKLKAMPIRSVEYMNVQLFKFAVTSEKESTRLDGKIDVELITLYAVDSIEEERERIKNLVQEQGLIVQEVIESPEIVTNPLFEFADTQVYKTVNDESSGRRLIDYELWQTAVSAQGYYYFITLLTPSRDYDYFLWTRNKNTYRLILNQLRPITDQFDYLESAD